MSAYSGGRVIDCAALPAEPRPVLILQHQPDDGPAYLATWLTAHGISFDLRKPPQDAVPESMRDHAALAVLGGAMSANDDLPMLRAAERLICDAVRRDRPVIGHCLGGQLMARALGGTVRRAQRPEIGWHAVEWLDEAPDWFGATAAGASVFQWHFDAFEPPPGAVRLAFSDCCAHQAFSIGPHLAMQFHIELDEAKLAAWTDNVDAQYQHARQSWPEQVQSRTAMLEGAQAFLRTQQRMAALAYARWTAGARFA